jgi:hypothetical protein
MMPDMIYPDQTMKFIDDLEAERQENEVRVFEEGWNTMTSADERAASAIAIRNAAF